MQPNGAFMYSSMTQYEYYIVELLSSRIGHTCCRMQYQYRIIGYYVEVCNFGSECMP